MNRRVFLLGTAGLIAGARAGRGVASEPRPKEGLTLSTGTYGFKGRPLDEAIGTIARLGYDGIEIAVRPGYGAEPESLSAERRREIGRRLEGDGLELTALMEDLPPSADDAAHKAGLDRLRRALNLARELRPAAPPLVQTVLGGGTWEEKRALFRDRLGDWIEAADAAGVVVAIKPHRGGAMSRPEEAAWLIRQLGDPPRLRMVFDYSHYAFRDIAPEQAVASALPITAHVAVKDAVKDGEKVTFALPGEGGFDHAPILKLLYDGGYRGDVCCEVSAVVSAKPGYDPVAAAETCYRNVAAAFARAGVPRRKG